MSTELEIYAAALRAERKLALKRAERRAPLLEAARRPEPAPLDARSKGTIGRWERLVRAARSLRRYPWPAHA